MVKTTSALLFVSLLASAPSLAQQAYVYYPYDNVAPNYATPAGWYPMYTNATGIRLQIMVPASAFSSFASSGLTSIGFFCGNSVPAATNVTYSILQVRIGPAAVPALTATFAANLLPGTETLVVNLPGTTYTPNPAGAWLDIPFGANFPVPTTNIIVDVQTQIPTGGAYLGCSVGATVPHCVSTADTGTQTTGTLSTASGSKVRFGGIPENILGAVTGGSGTGDLTLSLTNINTSAGAGYLLLTTDGTHALGTGPMFGIYPDATTWGIFSSPLFPGNPLHFPLGALGAFPDVPFAVPPGTLSFLAGQTWDAVVVLVDGSGTIYIGRSAPRRLVW